MLDRHLRPRSGLNQVSIRSRTVQVRDFFGFLHQEPDKDFYLALGSSQRVKVKARFQPKAKKAYNRCLEAIAEEGKTSANKKWREVFGTSVPLKAVVESARSFDNTEEFVEQKYPIDVQYMLAIDCTVAQNGWRPASLREMLHAKSLLLPNKELDFTIAECDVPGSYDVRWKVLNQGDEAERRNQIRGQIVEPNRVTGRHERTSFRGEHVVECYVVQDGVVVARDRIDVPISATPGASA